MSVAAPCPTAAAQSGPAVEYLANEGVLVTGGDIAVVIDGLFGEGLPEYPVVPAAMRDSLEGGIGRFGDIDLVLVTHRHDDHFDPAAVTRHLDANPETVLVAPGDVVAAFPPDRLERYGERVQALDLPPGSHVRLDMGGFAVEALGLAHAEIGHVGYRIELPGLTVLHLGDSEPAPGDLAAFLEGRPGPRCGAGSVLGPDRLWRTGGRRSDRGRLHGGLPSRAREWRRGHAARRADAVGGGPG